MTGDFVLAEIAGFLNSSIRRSDALVRYGGDEFLILLADTTATGAQRVVERIDGKLDEWNAGGNLEDFRLSVSIGGVEWHDGDTLDEMLDGADQRMYKCKGQPSVLVQ